MSNLVKLLLLSLSIQAVVSNLRLTKCCRDGARLNKHVQHTCNSKPPGSTNILLTLLPHEKDGSLCEEMYRPESGIIGGNQSEWAEWLPTCQTHSTVVTCNLTVDDVTTHVHTNAGNCYGPQCPITDSCWDEADGMWTLISCPCRNGACIRKCCPIGYIFNASGGFCIPAEDMDDWRPKDVGPFTLLPDSLPPQCETPHLLKIAEDFNNQSRCFSKLQLENRNQFTFSNDGSVLVNKYKFSLGQESYCGEHTVHENGHLILNNLVVCLPPDVTQRPHKFDVYGVLLIVGGCFLLLTVIISCCLPELRGSLYHKVAICHNIALMVASFTWGITNLLPSIQYHTCVTLSLLIQLTFLSSFFWMNVMCIDIALAFKNLRSVYGPAVDKGWNSLLWYSLYAWGLPLLLTGVTALMELTPNLPDFIQRPGFGCRNCGFDPETHAILIYFYGPMIFILVFNFILFIMTLVKIRSVEKQTAIVKTNGQLRKNVQNKPEIQQIVLFTKMFVLMGLTWGTEVLGWWLGGPAAIWYLPDLINFLRALFLCFLFIGKRSVVAAIKQKVTGKTVNGDAGESKLRRSKSSSVERKETTEIGRRGRVLVRQLTQITQTFRRSDSQV